MKLKYEKKRKKRSGNVGKIEKQRHTQLEEYRAGRSSHIGSQCSALLYVASNLFLCVARLQNEINGK